MKDATGESAGDEGAIESASEWVALLMAEYEKVGALIDRLARKRTYGLRVFRFEERRCEATAGEA